MVRWSRTIFLWFVDIRAALGDTLGPPIDRDLSDNEPDNSSVDIGLESTPEIEPTHASTPISDLEASNTPEPATAVAERPSLKRDRESDSQAPPSEKISKLSDIPPWEKLSEGLLAIANSMASDLALPGGGSDSSSKFAVHDHAIAKIQDESCLTTDGQLIMIDLFSDEKIARTYLVIKHADLRTKWLKVQLVRAGANLDTTFLNWE